MILSTLLTCAYVLTGASLWRMIVIPVHNDNHQTAQRELQQWRQDALAEEGAGNLAILIPKATFVLLWPLALGVGFAFARFTD